MQMGGYYLTNTLQKINAELPPTQRLDVAHCGRPNARCLR
jgi:hypothetical protein